MLISEKQHQANIENAKKSTGPQTPEARQAVRFNALKYGLRARSLLLPFEDPVEFDRLWDDFMAEWRPATRTELSYVEQLFTAQWLLARLSRGESRIYAEEELRISKQLPMLEAISRQRARLEHSFTAAVRELQRLQKERQPHAAETTAKPAKSKSNEPKPNRHSAAPCPISIADPSPFVCAPTDTR